MELVIENLGCEYHSKTIIQNISFRVKTGEIVCLLGPNGVGKTTFFKTLLGFIKPLNGTIRLNNRDMTTLRAKELARIIAYVPQAHSVPFPFTVEEVVVMGRHAHMGTLSRPTDRDWAYARECLEELGMSYLREKAYTQISGGEQQMALIARALTQETNFLIMDEPTSNLVFGNQVKILNQINTLKKRGIGVIMTTPSPDHVFLCGTKVVVFKCGELTDIGIPHSIVTEQLLQSVYDVNVKVRDMAISPQSPVKVCVPCLN